jgi:hypothetical protein
VAAAPLHLDCGGSLLNLAQVVRRELDRSSADVLLEPVQLRCAWDWNDPRRLR